MHPLIEVCVEGVHAAEIAIKAGADRLELNSSLDVDGLTPALEDLIAVKRMAATSIHSPPIICMLRPHAVSFTYDPATQLAMLRQLDELLASGADGVAVGGLTQEGAIDLRWMSELRKHSAGKSLVMHRAFDQLRDPQLGLEQLIELGVQRVLTSGGAVTAEAGIGQLQRLVVQSRGRIEILPGAGVRPANAELILRSTGCTQLHGTFKVEGRQPILPDPQAIAALKQIHIG